VEEGLDAGDASRLAEVSLGLATPDAGAFLVRHLERSSTQGDSSMRLLEHAARHAPLEEVGALSRISRERLRSDRERQQEILDSVLKGIEARGAAVPEELRSWAEEIASSILKDAGSAEPAWRPLPLAGASQRESPWALQKRLCADDGEERSLISSHPRGERLTGVLRSRTFAAPARLRFFLAGHDGFPGLLAQGRNFVQLVSADDGVVLARAAPPRNDIAQPVDWDLGPHADKSVYIEIVDGDDGLAFAWLAVGRFEPEVVPAPDVDPGAGDAKVVAACGLAAKVGLRALQPQILDVLRSAAADLAAREAAARALAAFEPQKSVLGALAPVFGEASLGEEIRGRTARAFDAPSDAVRREILVEALRSAPRRLQDAMAMALASNTEGAELLLTLINAGHASARLLLRPRLAERLRAAGIERAGERIERLTADLPSENEALGRLLDARRKGYAAAQASPARGAVVFERHCANCHQVAGKGSLIAPQLDGASARGLERLLEDVIDPNRNVDVAFRTTTLVLKDGQVASGLLRREEGVTLVLADAKGQEFRVPKDSVAREERSVLSLMPESLVEAVPEAEFYDLAAFLLGQRAVKPEDSKRD
jgi:putative heme-binding domain-containing protein